MRIKFDVFKIVLRLVFVSDKMRECWKRENFTCQQEKDPMKLFIIFFFSRVDKSVANRIHMGKNNATRVHGSISKIFVVFYEYNLSIIIIIVCTYSWGVGGGQRRRQTEDIDKLPGMYRNKSRTNLFEFGNSITTVYL